MQRKNVGFALVKIFFYRLFTIGRANVPFPGHLCNSGSLARIGLNPRQIVKMGARKISYVVMSVVSVAKEVNDHLLGLGIADSITLLMTALLISHLQE